MTKKSVRWIDRERERKREREREREKKKGKRRFIQFEIVFPVCSTRPVAHLSLLFILFPTPSERPSFNPPLSSLPYLLHFFFLPFPRPRPPPVDSDRISAAELESQILGTCSNRSIKLF
jgi:hypothetical protein